MAGTEQETSPFPPNGETGWWATMVEDVSGQEASASERSAQRRDPDALSGAIFPPEPVSPTAAGVRRGRRSTSLSRGATARQPRRARLAGAVGVVAVLIALAVVTLTGRESAPAELEASARAALAPLDDLPQDGITLGRSRAPATLTVYAYLGAVDLRFDNALPELIDAYVKPGRLKIQLRPLPSSPDAAAVGGSGAATAQAAGLQDRLWHFYRLLALEHPGYLDDSVVRRVAGRVPGLELDRLGRDVRSARTAAAVRRAAAMAVDARVRESPELRFDGGDGVALPVSLDGRGGVVSVLEGLLAP